MVSSKTTPLVTVVIPTFNYGRFIGQTLESVLAQTCRHWECFVVDDGSSDNTRDVVERYVRLDDRIKYVYQQNKRAGTARNVGIRQSSGKYLQFLDADDLLESRKLENQVAFLEQHPDVDIVYGGVRNFRADSPSESLPLLTPSFGEELRWMPQISGAGREALLALIRLPIAIQSPLVRKGSGDSVIYFDEKLKACEDWLYWVQCALEGRRFHYEKIDGTLAFYRQHATSACEDRLLVDAETRKLRQKLGRIIDDPESRRLNQRLAAEYEGDLAVKAMVAGKVKTAVWQLLKAGVLSPGLTEKLKWFFCAGIAPFAPRKGFENVLAMPALDTVSSLLRNQSRRAS